MEESRKLGMPTTINVFHAREQLRAPDGGGKSPLPANVDRAAARDIIKTIFGMEKQSTGIQESKDAKGKFPDA